MAEFDPGPPPEVAEHFDKVPSYAPHRDLFWYDWDPDGRNSGPNYGERFSESDYAPVPRGDLPFGVPSWLGDDARGRQSRPKRRNTVERDPADLLNTLIWRVPAG